MPWYGIIFAFGGLLLLLGGCCLLLARTCLLVITVQGHSMYPILEDGDRVLAIRPILRRWVCKGQIVLFRQSFVDEALDDSPLSLHVKRVAAQAGEQYISSLLPTGYHEHVVKRDHTYIWHIPQDHIFVCGDNSEQSIDSRSWGPLSLRNVRGIVVRKLSPSPASLSAQVEIVQRRIPDEKPI